MFTSIAVLLVLACAAPLPASTPGGTLTVQEQAQEERKPVDINEATAEQLQEVPGIGETLARRIVEFRSEHGPFEKVDDLLNVSGIGVTSLERLRPYLTVKQGG